MLSKENNTLFENEKIKKCLRDAKCFSSGIKSKKPSLLDTILRKRYQSRSVYYFTCERNVKEIEDEDKIQKSPFHFPKDIDDFSFRTKYREDHAEMRKKAQEYKYTNRPNYRSTLNDGKLERLFVGSEIELPGKSLTDDVDPEFFKIVSGKPIREKFDCKSYLSNLQTLFFIRLQIGYKEDETFLMEEQYVEEKRRLAEIKKRFLFYSECYDKFLGEDHTSSLELLLTAEEEIKKSKSKREKIRNLLRDCGWYRTKILILDEQWRIARVFQKFLYQVSPLWWRNQYDFLHKCKDTGDIDTSNTSLQGKSTRTSLTTVQSILTIIDQFIEDIAKAERPKLYFTDPKELLHIFYELEKNNLLALLQCEELTQPAQQMVSGLERARFLFKQEVDILTDHLKSLEAEVIFEENRSREYEKKAKDISSGLFKELIVDKSTLNLYVNVEDCFEVCVAPNDSNLPLSMMMKGIEYVQEHLMVLLDNLPNEIVLKALQTCYREDARVMREAQEATKMIIQIENLMKTLWKSLEPRKKGKVARRAFRRSEPPVEKMEMKVHHKVLTKEQLDYLYFFTDFCPTTEDAEVGKVLYAQKCAQMSL